MSGTSDETVSGTCEAKLADSETMAVTDEMVNRFLTWPLPKSVCADQCACIHNHPDRTGTNLLSFNEAKAMLQHVLAR